MIKFDKVSKNYGEQTVIYNQDFIIKDGEFFVMVGPSGCGKSTTIKMINRLVEPSTGDIYMDGKKIKDYPLRELRLSIGYVLQNIALFPNLTVIENIQLIPEMKGMKKQERMERAKELMAKVGLDFEKYAKRHPLELSGGEMQRVGILRAIIAHPKILLMDEPFSALDPIAKTQLQDLIKKIHQELKLTIIFVTHDMDEAMKLGDRICVMNKGKVIQLDTPENIRNNPNNKFIKEFFEI
ncbi:MAG: ABC transporter ATP-binding protein [Peptostreptococcaceae bacterium]|nr:ABC transporter ATP-binding protein [Peptostreptococcaceae bacterium]MDY5738710.1 ABC transporter ATP-binding protein [Anaerovoracaceae bacterium]SFE43138.1 osmoprotectant transport system ATP-binding protein [Peptostreptococcaceae bacterium pGA-8]